MFFSAAMLPDENKLSFTNRDLLKTPWGVVAAGSRDGQEGGSDIQLLSRARSSKQSNKETGS